MSVIANPNVVSSGLVFSMDGGSPRSYSTNVIPQPRDIYGWCGSANTNTCTISRDTSIDASPAGGVAMKMAITGDDPHVVSYGASTWNLATTASGQSWTISVYVKASVATTGQLFLFGAAADGTWYEAPAGTVTITTSWTRVSYTATLSNALSVRVQCRLDGTPTGGNGINIWWDGLQLERGSTLNSFNPLPNINGTNWYDVSSQGNNGTLNNMPTYNSSNLGAIVLDGVDDYVTIGTTGFPFGASAGSICAWAYATSVSGFGWIISYGTATTSQSRFLGRFDTTYYFGGYGNDITAAGLTINTWFYMVGTYDGTNASLYINGDLVAGPTAKTWNTVANNAQIGRQTNGGEYWAGRVGLVQVYNTALTAAQVAQNFAATRGRYGI